MVEILTDHGRITYELPQDTPAEILECPYLSLNIDVSRQQKGKVSCPITKHENPYTPQAVTKKCQVIFQTEPHPLNTIQEAHQVTIFHADQNACTFGQNAK